MMLPQVGVSGGDAHAEEGQDRLDENEAQMNVPCTISGAPSLLTAPPSLARAK